MDVSSIDVYEFEKAKNSYNFICDELHSALYYDNIEKFSRCLSDLGIFTPNSIFKKLAEYSAPRGIINRAIEHKKKNDVFINEIKSSLTKNEMTLSEVKLILNDFDKISNYDIINVQILLHGSSKIERVKDFKTCYSTNNIWNSYKRLDTFLNEMVNLAAYCGRFSTIHNMLTVFKMCKINFEFNPKKNKYHKDILSMLDEGISGGLQNDDCAGNIGPAEKTYYYEIVKKLLVSYMRE